MSNPFAIKPTAGGGTYECPPKGTWPATLAALVDLGTQTHAGFDGGEERHTRDVYAVFELEAEDERGEAKRYFVGKDFRLSLHTKSSLYKVLTKLLGREIGTDKVLDVTEALGRGCLVDIEHKMSQGDRLYGRIKDVAGLPRKLTAPTPTHKPFAWAIDGTEPPPTFDWMPRLFGRKLVEVIESSEEGGGRPWPWNAPAGATAAPDLGDEPDDDPDVY
jgi:hypothetical protein